MNFLIDPLKGLESYQKLIEAIKKEKSPIISQGILVENMGHILLGVKEQVGKQTLVITYEEKRAKDIYEDLVNLGFENVFLFPEKDLILYDIEAHSNDDYNKRLEVLSLLNQGKDIVVVTTIYSIFDKIISKEKFKELTKRIKLSDIVDLEKVIELLVLSGYERVAMVEGMGQFSVRGGILDYFPSDKKNPIRIEFFGDEIDSIRSFDIKTQRSMEVLEEVYIMPMQEVLVFDENIDYAVEKIKSEIEDISKNKALNKEIKSKIENKFTNLTHKIIDKSYISNRDILVPYIEDSFFSSIVDYFKEDSLIYIDEPRRIEEGIEGFKRNFYMKYEGLFLTGEVLSGHENLYYEYKYIKPRLLDRIYWQNSSLLTGSGSLMAKELIKFSVKNTQSYHKKMEILKEDLDFYLKNSYKIIILSGTEERGLRLVDLLSDLDIKATYTEGKNKKILEGQILITSGSLKGGFEYSDIKYVLINDKDIFGAGKRRQKRRRKDSKEILSFTDLKEGDYIVHENHGIGRYEGIEQLDIQGFKKDYLNIQYRDGDRLYVPIDQMNLIQKYIGSNVANPRINKLSSAEWVRTKKKALKAVEDMAEELLDLYAKREESKGFAFSKDSNWQREFEDYFPHEETEGQLISTEEIKRDMEKDKPMDRLLCGDVGYGKTEVSLRAAFKAILDGKQVAFLVPTTILAQQHYNTIKKRFKNYPVNSAVLSRFRTPKEQKDDIEKIKTGEIDIVVGTHRLLSKDVVFNDLGLLIIDEEQRFGVKHKEKLKQLKESIDVLTLTATPIPRTLHMSLSGIRDMSVIEDPPEERYPVQTYVVEYNEQMVRDAILKELARGGQVYFVYNKVSTIDKMAKDLQELVPEARFGVAHGQMGERMLENVMMDFLDKEYDVLVCTTIIETGLDVQNVNTIIIYDSDRLGLSQLYQLRGRVGRTNRMAYGYFTYEKNKVLSEVAESRLIAIKEFTEFGSGFKIAMRDLEIRGAGNLLGAQQHGQIEAIGYDLYVKFLNESIKRLRGEEVEELVDTIIDLRVEGYIKNTYIKDSDQKIEVYKKIGSIEDIDEYRELVDELIDRFGDLPKETENLMDVSYIRALASRNNIKSLIQNKKDVNLEYNDLDIINPETINILSIEYGNRIKFNLSNTPGFKYRIKKDVLLELKELLERIDSLK